VNKKLGVLQQTDLCYPGKEFLTFIMLHWISGNGLHYWLSSWNQL